MLVKDKLPDTMTANEAAEMIGVERTTVIDYIKRGWLKAYKVSPGETSPYRIYRESVERFIREFQGRKPEK